MIKNITILGAGESGFGAAMLANQKGYNVFVSDISCLLYTSPSPRDRTRSRMPSSA